MAKGFSDGTNRQCNSDDKQGKMAKDFSDGMNRQCNSDDKQGKVAKGVGDGMSKNQTVNVTVMIETIKDGALFPAILSFQASLRSPSSSSHSILFT